MENDKIEGMHLGHFVWGDVCYSGDTRTNTIKKWEDSGLLDGLEGTLKPEFASLFESKDKYVIGIDPATGDNSNLNVLKKFLK